VVRLGAELVRALSADQGVGSERLTTVSAVVPVVTAIPFVAPALFGTVTVFTSIVVPIGTVTVFTSIVVPIGTVTAFTSIVVPIGTITAFTSIVVPIGTVTAFTSIVVPIGTVTALLEPMAVAGGARLIVPSAL
jgi:hypothetical protein